MKFQSFKSVVDSESRVLGSQIFRVSKVVLKLPRLKWWSSGIVQILKPGDLELEPCIWRVLKS